MHSHWLRWCLFGCFFFLSSTESFAQTCSFHFTHSESNILLGYSLVVRMAKMHWPNTNQNKMWNTRRWCADGRGDGDANDHDDENRKLLLVDWNRGTKNKCTRNIETMCDATHHSIGVRCKREFNRVNSQWFGCVFFLLLFWTWDRVQDEMMAIKLSTTQQWQSAAVADVEESQRNEPIFYDYT